jgi:hypothetical protein
VVAGRCVGISVAAAVIQFVSSYEPLWLGLGAAAWICWRREPGRRTCRVRSNLLEARDHSGWAAVMNLPSWNREPSELVLRRFCRLVSHRTR